MSNDEMFFLCVLTGAEEILGIDNPVDGINEEAAKEKWHEVSKGLYESQILYNDKNGEICINDDYARISAAISFPDVAFECSTDDENVYYIYIKGAIYVQLRREEDCQIRLYDNREDFIDFLNQELLFSFSEDDICIEISENEMDKALEFYTTGKLNQAIEIFDSSEINTEKLQLALDAFVDNKSSRDFIGYRNNQEAPSQALFKMVRTEDGTWLFKIWNGNVKICRYNYDKALSEVLNF